MNPMTKNRSHRRKLPAGGAAGFTILETVIALCIMLVVGLGTISLFLFSTNYNAGASDRAHALALAQQQIEGYRAQDYTNLATTDTTQSVNVGSSTAGESDQRTFTVKTKIEYDPNVSNNRQRIITVTVTPAAAGRWTGGGVTLRLLRASNVLGS
jgi:type II secretory pathway pseudopilin PulG